MAIKKPLWAPAGLIAAACLVAAPRVGKAFKVWEATRREAAIMAARTALANGSDHVDLSALLTDPGTTANDPDQGDDAEVRRLAMAAEIGLRPPAAQQYLMKLHAEQRASWSKIAAAGTAPGTAGVTDAVNANVIAPVNANVIASVNANVIPSVVPAASVPGTRRWTNLGPLASRSAFNSIFYKSMDSGRPTAISIHPGFPNRTFVGTSGGGVWVGDLSSSAPSWQPITDNLGALAIGSIAIDPNFDVPTGRVTIWLGLGDFVDQQSGLLVKGTYLPGDAAGVWGPPITLGAASHPADLLPTAPLNIRRIQIDPTNSQHLFVGTDDGLYTSIDGGVSFQFVDLPNDPTVGKTRESVWDINYLGTGATGSQWLLSGVYACPTLPGATTGTRPVPAGSGSVGCAGDTNTAHFNKGDFWKSTDGGVTWTSIRAAGGLPPLVTQSTSLATEVGRIAFATGSTAGNPATTVVYAQAGTVQENGNGPFTVATSAYLKSIDGGDHWTRIATGLSLASPATTATAVTNPTIALEGSAGCRTMNLGHIQSWYNLTVAVDPGDSNRALFGGDLCSAVTVDGGTTFRLASHWLPGGGLGQTQNGFLGYVHSDWHTSLALRLPGQPALLIVGTDGGISVTRDIWDLPTPELGSWSQPDVGLATHLFYGIGTGDPTLGNPNVLFGGLQDNGTRFRLANDQNFIADLNAGNWDQVVGGDGIGAAAVSDTNGQNQVYWGSVNGSRRYCLPRVTDCSQATRIVNGVETSNWRDPGNPGVSDPFLIRYDTLGDDSGAVASASNESARLFSIDPVSQIPFLPRVIAAGQFFVDGTNRFIRGMGIRVSPYRYTIDLVPNTRIYGAVLTTGSGGPPAMGSFLVYDKPGVGVTTQRGPRGVGIPNPNSPGHTVWISNGSDFAAPQNPASLGGTDSKLTWLVSSNAVLSAAFNCANPAAVNCDPSILIPPAVGHIFKTIDGGNTWIPFHGNGTPNPAGGPGATFDLPNFPAYVMRYDPSNTTDQVIWVGTDVGVYRTTDGGNTWAPYGLGLPAVRITDIRISNNGSLVRVSTYGRGVWEIYPNSDPPVTAGTGDFNRSKVIDFFNMASLAARMGSTPGATPTPANTNNLAYDSAVDLDNNSIIDDLDLAALTAKFGSTLP